MTTPSRTGDSGPTRRVVATLFITTAAAAVTAGVVLHKEPEGSGAPAAAVSTDAKAARAAPRVDRRVQWRDPWKRPAPTPEWAATSAPERPDAVSRPDPSLPAAADALRSATDAAGESTSTF